MYMNPHYNPLIGKDEWTEKVLIPLYVNGNKKERERRLNENSEAEKTLLKDIERIKKDIKERDESEMAITEKSYSDVKSLIVSILGREPKEPKEKIPVEVYCWLYKHRNIWNKLAEDELDNIHYYKKMTHDEHVKRLLELDEDLKEAEQHLKIVRLSSENLKKLFSENPPKTRKKKQK